MAYLLCEYKEERNYVKVSLQISHPERDITSCKVNRMDFTATNEKYGLVRLINMDNSGQYPELVEVEIDDIFKGRQTFYVPRDNIQMSMPVKKK